MAYPFSAYIVIPSESFVNLVVCRSVQVRKSETDSKAVQEKRKTQENEFMDGVFADGRHRVIKQTKVKNNAGETPPKTFRGGLSHHSDPLKANSSISCSQCAPPYLHLHALIVLWPR